MPDGGYGPDFLSRSMFFREAEGGPSQQELATMTAPFGGSPEQARAFLQSPGAQQMLQHFGLSGFDPSQIRQSPFLPNSFMQHHPMLGHGLSSAMANVAATPEAPMVSGAGSGMSRAMQGLYGGNELQRNYQVRQLMAPFQAMGMQMPAMAEQRRQELLQALEQDMQHRQQIEAQTRPDQMEARRQLAEAAEIKARAAQDAANRPHQTMGPIGTGYITEQNVPGHPAGGLSGTELQQQPGMPGARGMQDFQTGQQFQMPGWGLSPEQQAGWSQQYTPYDQTDMRGQFDAKATGSQTPEKGALLKSQTGLNEAKTGTEASRSDELKARGERERAQAAQPGGHFGAARQERFQQEYNKAETHHQDQVTRIRQLMALPKDKGGLTPEEGQSQIQQWDAWLATQKENIDRGMGKPGQSAREAGTINPGAKTPPPNQTGRGGAAGGAGSQVNQNMAPGTAGLPPGYTFGPDGIPRPVQQSTQPQQ